MKEHVEIEYQQELMRGYHDNAGGEKIAIVTHGIGGNKLGHKYVFKQFADECVANGISTLRLDFIGSGESEGDFADTRHSNQSLQLEAIIKYAQGLNYKQIYLVSTTIGCYSTWHASQTDFAISGIINWNPIVNFDRYQSNNIKSAKENYEIDLNGLFLKKTYIEDLKKLNRNIPTFNCPVLCIQGELDFETKFGELVDLCERKGWEYDSIIGANHLWEGNEVRRQLFARTINFIKEYK